MQITTCPPPICNEYAEARHGEAACGGAAVPREAPGPRALERTVKCLFQWCVAEMGHEVGSASGNGGRAEVGRVAGCYLVEGNRGGFNALGTGGPSASPGLGMNQHGGSAPIVVQPGTDFLDAPKVGDGEVGPGAPFARHATVAGGAQAEIGQEGADVAIGVEVLTILTGVGESRHQ